MISFYFRKISNGDEENNYLKTNRRMMKIWRLTQILKE